MEPADSQEAYEMTLAAFELSEKFQVPVILRMTTRINHVKSLVVVGEREAHVGAGFQERAGAFCDGAGQCRQAHTADVRARRKAA
jgi:indolepyruvate ferredoxin oxidoreductase alpha subunit